MQSPLDDSYRLLAAQYMRKQIRQLVGQFEGIRKAEDIECVHRARVASRRLRAALRMFGDCFGRKRRDAWRRAVRRVTKELGDVRDKDVQIVFVRQVLNDLRQSAPFAGIVRLLMHLELDRDALQPAVVEALERLEASRVLAEMMVRAKRMSSGMEARGVTVRSRLVLSRAAQEILDRVERLLALEDGLDNPRDTRQHHALRIAVKRLRYTMEMCRPIYVEPFHEIFDSVKQLQTLLGEVHDCDVWDQSLQQHLEVQRKRVIKCYGHPGPLEHLQVGIDYLRQNRQAQREQAFAKLVEYWRGLSARALWDRLADLLRLQLETIVKPEVANHPSQADRPHRADGRAQNEPLPPQETSPVKVEPRANPAELPSEPAGQAALPE